MPGPEDGDILVRPATVDDLGEATEVYLAVRREGPPSFPELGEPVEALRAVVADWWREREVWVAERDRLVGFAALDGDWLESLYVGPADQGQGIGTMLLGTVMAARPGGFGLRVYATNAPARAFYHRHGLVELEHTDGSTTPEGSPEVAMAWPGADPLSYLRGQIDQVDDELAVQLARRMALSAAVQGFKPVGGHAGRDPDRERRIAERMAQRVPGTGAERLARIMHVVIGESLDAWERRARH